MAEGTYIRKGDVITYTNPSSSDAIEKGQVVSLTTRIGIAVEDIAASGTGALAVSGVWKFDAENDAAFTVGAALYWDVTAREITATDAGANEIAAGWAVAAKDGTATTCYVKIG